VQINDDDDDDGGGGRGRGGRGRGGRGGGGGDDDDDDEVSLVVGIFGTGARHWTHKQCVCMSFRICKVLHFRISFIYVNFPQKGG